MGKNVILQQVLPEEWENTLIQAGFLKDEAENLMLMTKAVIDGKTKNKTINPIRFSTDFKSYLKILYEQPNDDCL